MRADLISVFDGTQPVHRQSPPSLCFSTSATLAPSDAPPAATTRPPEPPPMTTRSKSGFARSPPSQVAGTGEHLTASLGLPAGVGARASESRGNASEACPAAA